MCVTTIHNNGGGGDGNIIMWSVTSRTYINCWASRRFSMWMNGREKNIYTIKPWSIIFLRWVFWRDLSCTHLNILNIKLWVFHTLLMTHQKLRRFAAVFSLFVSQIVMWLLLFKSKSIMPLQWKHHKFSLYTAIHPSVSYDSFSIFSII